MTDLHEPQADPAGGANPELTRYLAAQRSRDPFGPASSAGVFLPHLLRIPHVRNLYGDVIAAAMIRSQIVDLGFLPHRFIRPIGVIYAVRLRSFDPVNASKLLPELCGDIPPWRLYRDPHEPSWPPAMTGKPRRRGGRQD